jgi:hypothetical protein
MALEGEPYSWTGSWSEMLTLYGSARVFRVQVAIGNGSTDLGEPVYIDDIGVNTDSYPLEPAPGTVTLGASYTPTIGISVDPTSINFGAVTPGTPSAAKTVTVTNTGNVAEDFSASITNESLPGVYTTGLRIAAVVVSVWSASNVAVSGFVNPELILTVPTGTPPGTYAATLIFWAEATP